MAVINVKNDDNICFLYSVLAALHHEEVHAERVSHYKKYLDTLKFQGIELPVRIDQVHKFDHLNNLTINVYTMKHNGKEVTPLYISKTRDFNPINLLLIQGKNKNHYTWIKSFDRSRL